MGLPPGVADSATMSQLYSTADRLRSVRRATRRFMVLWAMERDVLGRVARGVSRDANATDDHDDDECAQPPSPSPARRFDLGVDREGSD
jgi:hypothetical protein